MIHPTSNSFSRIYYPWLVFRGCMNTLVHSLISVSVFVTLCFAFQSIPLSAFQLHIGFSVAGYQLLMSHGILSLSSYNGWSSTLTPTHRRQSHWVLQVAGSVLAITGSVIMMRQKSVNFNTIHGKLALAALIMTCVSLLNGVITLYRVNISNIISIHAFKTSHLFAGISSFTLSSACLSFGFVKNSFTKWSSIEFSYVMIVITCTYTILTVIKPCYAILKKLCHVINKLKIV